MNERGRHLYVLFGVATRRCKIGCASDVQSRFRDLRNASADDLILWAWAKDCGADEISAHYFFAEHRLHGEWFSPSVTAFIARRVARQSKPSGALARLCTRWRREQDKHSPRCPQCGSAERTWRVIGNHNICRCAACGWCRHSIRLIGGS